VAGDGLDFAFAAAFAAFAVFATLAGNLPSALAETASAAANKDGNKIRILDILRRWEIPVS
jgi:hypothetical protein